MTDSAALQLALPLSGEPPPAPKREQRKARPHHRPRSDGPLLPLAQPRFLPVIGVPKTRGECPPSSQYCPHIRCRWHLALVDADHRPGRPGLSHVPRDERGRTVPVEGDMGEERAGTTVAPRWLELERRCSVWVERDADGRFVTLHAEHESEWDQFRERLRIGEPIDVLVDGTRVGGAVLKPDGLSLDHTPAWFSAVLERVRGVPSCALYELQRLGKMTNEQAGHALNRHRTLVAREAKDALRKAMRRARAMGMTEEEFMGALKMLGAK